MIGPLMSSKMTRVDGSKVIISLYKWTKAEMDAEDAKNAADPNYKEPGECMAIAKSKLLEMYGNDYLHLLKKKKGTK